MMGQHTLFAPKTKGAAFVVSPAPTLKVEAGSVLAMGFWGWTSNVKGAAAARNGKLSLSR